MSNMTTKLTVAAFAGLLGATALPNASYAGGEKMERAHLSSFNEVKYTSHCWGRMNCDDRNACAGKNSCDGKHNCLGKNSCDGKHKGDHRKNTRY